MKTINKLQMSKVNKLNFLLYQLVPCGTKDQADFMSLARGRAVQVGTGFLYHGNYDCKLS